MDTFEHLIVVAEVTVEDTVKEVVLVVRLVEAIRRILPFVLLVDSLQHALKLDRFRGHVRIEQGDV